MDDFAPVVWAVVMVALFLLADWLFRRLGSRAWTHPTLLPTVVLGGLFACSGISDAAFVLGTAPFHSLMVAAIAGLAVPLYRNWHAMHAEKAAVAAAIIGGSLSGVISALGIGLLFSAPADLMASIAAKSVTTPIAVTVAEAIGGSAPMAAMLVIVTGLFAAIFGPGLLRLVGIDDDMATGLALGTAGHAIGMAEAVRRSDLMAAAAAFAMTANGLATAIVLPLAWG